MASVKAPPCHVRPSSLFVAAPPLPLSASRPALLSQLSVPALTPAFHLCHPPHLSLSLTLHTLLFCLFFRYLCPPTFLSLSLSLSQLCLSFFIIIIPPYSLIIFPDELHSWTTSGLYSQALPIIFYPFKMHPFSEKCARPRRTELPAAVICHRVINSKTPLLGRQLQIAGTQSVLVKSVCLRECASVCVSYTLCILFCRHTGQE